MRLARVGATPDNVVPLLHAHAIPRDFAFLSLDIDGYDHFVLPPAEVVAALHQRFAAYEGRYICEV